MKCTVLTFFVSWILAASSENILMLHSFWVGSHLYPFRGLAELFVEMGHTVTILRYLDTTSPGPRQKRGITEIVITFNNTDGRAPFVTNEEKGKLDMPMKHFWEKGLTLREIPIEFFEATPLYYEDYLSRKSLMTQFEQSNFSLAVVDVTFSNMGLVFSHHLGIPTVGFAPADSTVGPMPYTTAFSPPSVTPLLWTWLPDKMTFPMRVLNSLYMLGLDIVMKVNSYAVHKIEQKYYPGTPTSMQLMANIDAFMYDAHPALQYPRPLFPTFAQIGGIQLRDPNPLPEDLENFVQSSGDDGFIIFSLGISFDPRNMPEEKFQSYFTAFSKLKQKIIVRSSKAPAWVPENVKILPSIPQLDLLGHPKIALFIAHGGSKGLIEAMHFGVPVVGIPIFLDQMDNLLILEQRGAAKVVTKWAGHEMLLRSITDVLENKEYRENAKKQSDMIRIFENPKKKATKLINFMLKSGGAKHIKMGGLSLNIFQYFCIDVTLFLFFGIIILGILIYYITKLVISSMVWHVLQKTSYSKKNS